MKRLFSAALVSALIVMGFVALADRMDTSLHQNATDKTFVPMGDNKF